MTTAARTPFAPTDTRLGRRPRHERVEAMSEKSTTESTKPGASNAPAAPTTVELLMIEYGEADIPLEKVARKYLGIDNPAQARRQAREQRLPFPAFRAGSQKSQWLVRVTDLAEHLDRVRQEAMADHKRPEKA